MLRVPVVLGLALLLLAAGASPALAQGPEERRGRGPPARVGDFEVLDGRAAGEHVSFSYTEGGIQAFTVGAVALFDAAVTGPAENQGDSGARAQGSEIRVRMPTYRFVANDNPSGVSRLESAGRITITFTDGTTVARGADGRITFQKGELSGALRVDDDATLAGRTVTTDGRLLVFVDAPRGAFDVHRGAIGRAIAKGDVGAEGTFNQLEDVIQQDVVSYGNVTMTTTKAEKGNLTVVVEGHGFEGRVLVLNVDGRVLGAARSEDLIVKLDNLSLAQASNLTDILDPDDDGYQPEYYIVHDPLKDPDAFQLIVTVPHYSVHTLSVSTAILLPPPSVAIGLVAGLALLVPAGYVLFRRR